MKRLGVAVLSLGLLALAACTHGLELERGQRPARPITRISFLFAEGQSDIFLDQPQAPADPDQSAGPAQVSTPAVDIEAIAANDAAMALVVPAAEVDPGLQTLAEDANPSSYISLELIAESKLTSFFITGSRRQITADSAGGRPFQLVQRLFVHADPPGADAMFQTLLDEAMPQDADSIADSAVSFFRQMYPDLTAAAGPASELQLADATRLIEIRLDPGIAPRERQLGPGDPHIYYLLLRQGRVTALFEIYYLSAQEPGTISVLGERLINRIPPDLVAPQPSNA